MPSESSITPPSGARAVSRSSGPTARIRREEDPGMVLVTVECLSITEFHLTATLMDGESTTALAARVARILTRRSAVPVRILAYGRVGEDVAIVGTLRQLLEDPGLTATWVEGAACDGGAVAGLQIHAIAGTSVRSLTIGSNSGARLWSDHGATHCVFNRLAPSDLAGSRTGQSREVLEMLHAGLAQAGMGMNNLARTWFFLDRILSWYGDFNGVRNDFFSRTELRAAGVPASTGVGGRNPAAASLASAAWAVRASDPASHPLVIVPSPLQCPAPAYGSAFSRALEIQSPGFRQLLVSGTASIEPGGRTAHPGDVQAQIGLTMEVVDAILASRGMSFSDVTRATAYYRSASDAPRFAGWLDRHDLRRMPIVHACCDICRDDLLFEIELDAIRPA